MSATTTRTNQQYHDFFGEHADAGDDCGDYELIDTGKVLAYIGWFWRWVDIAGRRIPLGWAGGFVGIMANNKWDYYGRDMTDEEAAHFVSALDAAMDADAAGATRQETAKRLRAVSLWMQGLEWRPGEALPLKWEQRDE